MFAAHQPPSPAEAAALRAVALALDRRRPAIGGTDASGILRTVAATVTLVEKRSKGESTGRRGHHPRPRLIPATVAPPSST